jgi:hypothetical protein
MCLVLCELFLNIKGATDTIFEITCKVAEQHMVSAMWQYGYMPCWEAGKLWWPKWIAG